MKKFISILFFGAMALAAFAQEQEEKYPNEWFVGVGAGFNYSFDTDRYSTGFDGKGVGTSLDLYAGKWFNRVFGMPPPHVVASLCPRRLCECKPQNLRCS